MTTDTARQAAERGARQRVEQKLGLALHWLVYLAVNTGLVIAVGGLAGSGWRLAGWGLGLAVPVNDTTRRIVGALVRDGRVRRAYLGLVSTPAPLPAALAERTGRRRGLRIVDVVPGSPADRAGLKAGDLVLEAARRPVAEAQSLQRLLFDEAIGRPLPVTVHRRGAMVDVITVPTELTGD